MRLRAIYEGFANSPFELAVFLTFIGLFFVVLPVLSWLHSRRLRREQVRQARTRFQHALERQGLVEHERQLLNRLTRYLKDPAKAYVLLDNQGLFDAVVRQALADGVMDEDAAAALRVKLGFAAQRTGSRVTSSTEFPAGAALLLLRQNGNSPVPARVREQKPDALRLQLRLVNAVLPPGETVEVVYHDASGVYRFTSQVIASEHDVAAVAHSERLECVQRRQFYRAPLQLPVYVQPAMKKEPAVVSHFYDLGGGGASIANPNQRFRRGDQVVLSFHPDSQESLRTIGRVVRTSKRNSVAHISFENLTQEAQDRLYGALFQQGSPRGGSETAES